MFPINRTGQSPLTHLQTAPYNTLPNPKHHVMMSTFAYHDPTFDDISPLDIPTAAHDGGHSGVSQNGSIHPAVLAAIAMGCITAFFALVTWSMNICILLGRVRRQEKARKAQEVPSGPTTVEPRVRSKAILPYPRMRHRLAG